MILVIDASVVAKWFLSEPDSEIAQRLLHTSHELVAPELLRLELGSVLLQATRRGALSLAEATAAVQAVAPPVIRLEDTRSFVPAALAIAGQFGGSIYDALYLALARDRHATVVTADAMMSRIAQEMGVAARTLSDEIPEMTG